MSDETTTRTIQFTEAPASATIKMYSPAGFDVLLTIRDNDAKALLARLNTALAWLPEHGFTPTGYKPTNGNQPPPAPSQPAGAPPPAVTQAAGSATFAAGSLVATVNEGKTYWKVRGGRWAKHGVTIWPEALATVGFDAAVLDPMQVYDLNGYTAHVEMEGDKPRKVTKLEKAA